MVRRCRPRPCGRSRPAPAWPRCSRWCEKFRKADKTTPIVLMGYYNPIHAYGTARFARDVAAAGVDGLIVVDLPLEEDEVLRVPARAQGVDLIRFVTPTTDEARLKRIVGRAPAAIFIMSRWRASPAPRPFPKMKCAPPWRGCGRPPLCPARWASASAPPEQADAIARIADGVVVGSAIVARVAANTWNARARDKIVAEVLELAAALAGSTHAARRDKVYGMNWITNIVRPRIKGLIGGKGRRRRRHAGKSLEEMPVLRRDDLPPRPDGQPECLPQLRPSHAHRPGRALRLYLRCRQLHRTAAAQRSGRSAALQGRQEICRRNEVGARQDRPARSLHRRARHHRRPAGDDRGAALRFPGRQPGPGRGRGAGGIPAGRHQGKARLTSCSSPPAARACRKAFCP